MQELLVVIKYANRDGPKPDPCGFSDAVLSDRCIIETDAIVRFALKL